MLREKPRSPPAGQTCAKHGAGAPHLTLILGQVGGHQWPCSSDKTTTLLYGQQNGSNFHEHENGDTPPYHSYCGHWFFDTGKWLRIYLTSLCAISSIGVLSKILAQIGQQMTTAALDGHWRRSSSHQLEPVYTPYCHSNGSS